MTYFNGIEPINGKSIWPKVTAEPVHPPPFRKMPERPKINRKKGLNEIGINPSD